MKNKPKLGLVLGRFQPFHLGHLHLINLALKENDQIVICIGSAQKAEPLTIEERHKRMQKQLELLGFSKDSFKIVDLVDPKPMSIWPAYVKKVCKIKDDTNNTFYRGQKLPARYTKDLKKLGFRLKIIERISFYTQDKNGYYHIVDSATEIRELFDNTSILVNRKI